MTEQAKPEAAAADTKAAPAKVQNFAQQPMSAPKGPLEILSKGEKTVTMIFPKDVMLNVDNHTRVLIRAGVQEVPESIAPHWWLKANGGEVYKGKSTTPVKAPAKA